MKELEQEKCPNCGFMNIKLTKKCTKCNYDLDEHNKSCPRCGRIQPNSYKKCECGFSFSRKKRSIIGNLIITLVIMALLLVVFNLNNSLFDKFSFGLKVVLVFGIVVMVIKTFTKVDEDAIAYSAEAEMAEHHKSIYKMKKISNIAIIIGAIAIAVFLICYYVFK